MIRSMLQSEINDNRWYESMMVGNRTVQFISSTIASVSSGTAAVNVSTPAEAQSGDLLVAVGINGNLTYTWTVAGSFTENLDSGGRLVASSIWTGGASHTFTSSSSNGSKTVALLLFRYATIGAVSTVGTAAADPIAPSTSLGSVTVGSIRVGLLGSGQAGNTYNAPDGWTTIYNQDTPTTMGVFIQNDKVTTTALASQTFVRATGSLTSPTAVQFSITPTV